MSAALDANILIYASNTQSVAHEPAKAFLRELSQERGLFFLFWPTILAYLRVVTHPSLFRSPISPERANDNIDRLLALPHARSGTETERFWETWRALTGQITTRGKDIPDAHLVALMHEHGVGTLWTTDRDFRRYPGIRVIDPLRATS